MKSGKKIIFSGRVQGVGFRYRTHSIAQRFQVCGYVKNLIDGTVELVIEGEEEELDERVQRDPEARDRLGFVFG